MDDQFDQWQEAQIVQPVTNQSSNDNKLLQANPSSATISNQLQQRPQINNDNQPAPIAINEQKLSNLQLINNQKQLNKNVNQDQQQFQWAQNNQIKANQNLQPSTFPLVQATPAGQSQQISQQNFQNYGDILDWGMKSEPNLVSPSSSNAIDSYADNEEKKGAIGKLVSLNVQVQNGSISYTGNQHISNNDEIVFKINPNNNDHNEQQLAQQTQPSRQQLQQYNIQNTGYPINSNSYNNNKIQANQNEQQWQFGQTVPAQSIQQAQSYTNNAQSIQSSHDAVDVTNHIIDNNKQQEAPISSTQPQTQPYTNPVAPETNNNQQDDQFGQYQQSTINQPHPQQQTHKQQQQQDQHQHQYQQQQHNHAQEQQQQPSQIPIPYTDHAITTNGHKNKQQVLPQPMPTKEDYERANQLISAIPDYSYIRLAYFVNN